jgi:uncharacterized protein
VTGGRSAGARVACRTAAQTGAIAVLCLAFPLIPPGRSPDKTRLPELEAVHVPVLVVQGDRDSFGIPPEGPSRTVITVPGTHAFRSGFDAIAGAAQSWLERVTPSEASPAPRAS